MGDRMKYERFLWFHGRVKTKRYPNAAHLVAKYEISHRTAQRDVEFMRERLAAPLEFDSQKKGYYYSDNSFELPSLLINEDNIMALSLAVRLATSIPDHEIKQRLCNLIEKIFDINEANRALCFETISEKISVKNIEYSRVDEKHFRRMVDALFKDIPITIAYHSPHNNQKTVRTIQPLHLVHYMGSWHIIAFCAMRKGLRDFALSRIKASNVSSEKIALPPNLPSIKQYVRKHFGIMQGGKTKEVCLSFSPSVAAWTQEQVWHPLQKMTFKPDGSLVLEFPVADFRR